VKNNINTDSTSIRSTALRLLTYSDARTAWCCEVDQRHQWPETISLHIGCSRPPRIH